MRYFVIVIIFLAIYISGELSAQNLAGNALRFDGVDDYVDCRNDASLNINDKLTIEAWIYSTTFNNGRIVSKWGLETGYDLDVVTSPGVYNKDVRFNLNQITRLNYSLAGFESQWVHLAATWDGTTCKLYVNGNLATSGGFSGTIENSQYNLLIGRMANLAPSVWDGLINEVRIWNRSRTQSQIQATMNDSLTSIYYATDDSALVGYWRFDVLNKNVTPDLSIYGNHGTISGAVSEPSNPPLPVELASFSGTIKGQSVMLRWQTVSETNNYGFEIERFVDSGWEVVGFVNGHGTTTEIQRYEFTDYPLHLSSEVRYRLKQIDTDGSFEYSRELTVTMPVPQAFQLDQNYPNPFNPATTISYSIPTPGFVTLRIYDLTGHEVRTLINETQAAGTHKVDFDAGQLSSGIYFYELNAGGSKDLKPMLYLQ